MINDTETVESTIVKKDNSKSEGSEHSLDGFDQNVSYSEYADETNQLQEQPENNIIEEEETQTIEKRCGYCNISNPKLIVKCNEKDCQRWFCNGRTDQYSASHIVFHLTKSKHKEVFVSKESAVGEMVLECYNCSSKNIFLLGFLESKEGDSGFILCREPCLTSCKIEEEKFDKSKWTPLIHDKKILDWIVQQPEENDMKFLSRVNIRTMSKLEDKWEKDKLNNMQEKPVFLGNFLNSVKLSYNEGQEYIDTFEPLISAEEEYDRKLKESQKKQNIKVSFYKSGKKIISKLIYPKEDNEIKLVPGDELKIIDPRTNKCYNGFIIKIEIDDEIHIELEKCENLLQDGQYTVEFVWKGTSFRRMLDGIYSFVNDENSVSSYIYYKVFGENVQEKKTNYQNIPKDFQVRGLPELNYYQTLGIKKALQSPLFLIQGPPGTGKTVISAAIVYHLANLKIGKVLVCAPSNIAADQLSEKISKTGLKVVRVCAKSRESISSRVEYLSLHNQIKNLNPRDHKRLFDLIRNKEETGELSKEDHEMYKKLKIKAENEVINESQVVVTTCIASFDKRLNNFRFPLVLIDEATQACEPECLLPLLRGAKHAILVGDHCQLGPVVLCKNAAKAGLKISLFERLVKLKIKPHMLQVQYRMHPKLSEFPSNTFYSGSLQNGVAENERIHEGVNFPWPNYKKPMFFFHVNGQEEFSASGTSYLNRREAEFIEKCVTMFLKSAVKPEQLGIITPYEGQRSYIVTHMLRNGSMNLNLYKDIEVASVDSFQGREKDYILLSCVRSNDHNGIGFLNDPRRLNVALTRARYGIVICGNAQLLAKHLLWNNLLYHFKQNGLLVEGNLNNYKEMIISLKPPREYLPERGCFENQLNTSSDTMSLDLNYVNELNKEKYHEFLNDATISRFSEFGYSNEAEVIEHFHKAKNYLRNRPLKVPMEPMKNKFDIGVSKLLPNYPPMTNHLLNNMNSNSMNNNSLMSSFSSMNSGRNQELNEISNYLNMTNFKFNNFDGEKKFVLETRF